MVSYTEATERISIIGKLSLCTERSFSYSSVCSSVLWGLLLKPQLYSWCSFGKYNLCNLYSFLIVNSKKKPFSTIALNDLETLSLVTSMITVYCGLFFISDKPEEWIKNNPDYSNSAIHLDNDTKLFFFAVIVFVNLIFFTYWSYKMYQEIKAKFRSKLPKIYLAMCLCFNSRKLQFEIVSHELYLENEGFREEYFKKLHNLKQLYRDGKLVLTQNSIERVVKYLDERNVIEVSGVTEKPDVFEQQKAQKRFNRIRYGLAN